MPDPGSHSERSPLLGKPAQEHTQGTTATSEPDNTGEDLARHESIDEDRAAQFEGNAEVRKQLKLFFPAVAIGVFLAAADVTIIVSSYGKIGSQLNALNLTSWIATAYLISQTAFQPLYGKLSDVFGRKGCLLFAYTVFGLGGLWCGLASSIESLIVARLFQGMGGGGMTTVVSILLSDIVPLKDRGVWQGLINIIYAAGAASGAPLGGFCADTIGWRWTFLAQAPLSLLAIIAVAVVMRLPPLPDQDKPWQAKVKRIDFLGAIVLLVAVFAILYGLDRGSNISWSTPTAYGPLIASLFLFTAFVYVETRFASEPFAPGRIIFTRNMFATYTCYFCQFAAWLSTLYFLPLYFQAANGISATAAGLRLLPAIATIVAGSLCAGFTIKATGKYKLITIVAYTALAAGIIPIFVFSGPTRENVPAIIIGTVISGMGNGISVTSALIALIADASPADQAIATACSYLFRGLGSTVGIALSATIVQSVLRSTLQHDLAGHGGGDRKNADDIVRRVRHSLDYLDHLDPETQRIVRNAYGNAVRHSYYLIFGFCVAALISSFFIREKRLSR